MVLTEGGVMSPDSYRYSEPAFRSTSSNHVILLFPRCLDRGRIEGVSLSSGLGYNVKQIPRHRWQSFELFQIRSERMRTESRIRFITRSAE